MIEPDEVGKLLGRFESRDAGDAFPAPSYPDQYQRRLIAAIVRMQAACIAGEARETIFTAVLREFLTITRSECGLLGEVTSAPESLDDLRPLAVENLIWPDRRNQSEPSDAPPTGFVAAFRAQAERVVVTREPVIAGAGDAGSSLKTFLGLPLVHDGRFVGIICLANGPEPFDDSDRRYLEPLVETAVRVVVQAKEDARLRQTSGELLEQLNFFNTLTNAIPNPIFYCDAPGAFQGCNAAFESLTGRTRRSIIGAMPSDVFAPETAAVFADIGAVLREQGGMLSKDIMIALPDGSARRCIISVAAYRSMDGMIAGLVGVVIDITERVHAEEALQSALQRVKTERARSEAVIAAIGEGLCIIGRDYRVLYQNAIHQSYFGDHPGGTCHAVFMHKGHVCVNCPAEKAFNDGLVHTARMAVLREDGVMHIEATASPLRDHDGSISAVVVLERDITKQHAEDEAMRKLSRAVEQAADTIVITDRQGGIEYVNPAFEKVTGYSADEVRGKTLGFLKSGLHPPDFFTQFWETIQGGRVFEGVFVNRRKDGSLYHEEKTVTPLTDGTGRLTHFVATGKDITARVHAENMLRSAMEKLERLNRELEQRVSEEVARSREKDFMLIQQARLAAMGEMIGNIAHQWRQPLNSIGLIIQNLRNDFDHGRLDDAYFASSAGRALKIIDHMSQTIDDFRDFFKPDQARHVFKPADVVRRVVSLVDASFADHMIALELALDETVEVEGYSNQYAQVLLNVMNNARDAVVGSGVPSGRVSVVLDRYDGRSRVVVTDNGGGIAEAELPRIFDPYFSTKGSQGTGIGLYMAKTIIEKNMGGIIAARNAVHGAEFTIIV